MASGLALRTVLPRSLDCMAHFHTASRVMHLYLKAAGVCRCTHLVHTGVSKQQLSCMHTAGRRQCLVLAAGAGLARYRRCGTSAGRCTCR